MIDFLNKNIDGISKEKLNNVCKININNNFDDILLINWENLSLDCNLEIIIKENVKIKLLEMGTVKGKCIYRVKENATLIHNFIFLASGGDAFKEIFLDKDASWEGINADLSTENVHFILHCYLKDENSKGYFKLSTLSKNQCKKVFDINFIHETKKTISSMENYGVVQNEASLSFLGVGHIKKGTKSSQARQSAKIMIFDKLCKASASPILKIDENDTIASHAAALGKINDEHLFYLMSRGISESEAKKIITLGYLNPILPHIFDEDLRKSVEKYILERL